MERFEEFLLESLEHLNAQTASTREAVENLNKGQRRLFDLVANGNGHPSILSQLATIQTQLTVINDREERCREHLLSEVRKVKASTPASRIKRFGYIGALLGAVAAAAFTVWECIRG